MKTYYTTDSNGKIAQSANWPFPGSQPTEKEIIRGYDGGLYFVGDEPSQPAEQQAVAIRAERDRRLAETDLIIIRCVEVGEPVPEEWKAYRQALRDIPEQSGFPDNVVWPTCISESMKLD
ncbi:MAG: phage tail assembly chaperone [Lachnospiraceae bacterium]|nr:phage tail assembly chaperone [Lachnospiraceae bacterium]